MEFPISERLGNDIRSRIIPEKEESN